MHSINTMLAIDVGSTNLKMAQFQFAPNGAATMTAFDFRRLEIDPEAGDAAESLAFFKAYNEMMAANKFDSPQVRLSLSPRLSFQRLSKLPPVTGSRSAIDKIVELEARQTVPYAINDVEWGYQLLRHQWSEKHQETAEDGTVTETEENKEEFEAMFVAIKTDKITAYTDLIQDSGKKVLSVEIAPVALFNAAAGTQINEEECTLLLNIGGSCSSLMIADHNRAFIRTIPIAGDSITNQIAKEFNIPFADAEQMKQRYGFVALGGAYEEPDSELASTISKIARNIMTRLHGEVSRSINVWRAQHGGSQPAKVLLSGGASVLLYMTDFFQEKLRIPVEYLNTFGSITLAPDLDKEKIQGMAPMVQELIGLTMSGESAPINISLLPKAIRNQCDLDHKKPYFYGSAAILLTCLVLFGFGISRLLYRENQRAARVQIKVDETTKIAKAVGDAEGKLNSAKGLFDETVELLKQRNRFTLILGELQSLLPDMMWLTSLECTDTKPQAEKKKIVVEGDSSQRQSGSAAEIPYSQKDVREIKYLWLKGYTISVPEPRKGGSSRNAGVRTQKWLPVFVDRVKKSAYFQEKVELRSLRDLSGGNLTSFDLLLELKEPVRK